MKKIILAEAKKLVIGVLNQKQKPKSNFNYIILRLRIPTKYGIILGVVYSVDVN